MSNEQGLVLVTGGSNGIGFAICLGLLKAGRSVLLIASTQGSGEAAVAKLRAQVPEAEVSFLACNLESLQATALLAAQIVEGFPGLSSVILNAGIVSAAHANTLEGVERTFAINHLSQFLLLRRLLPSLLQQPVGRIVFTASQIHADGFSQAFEQGPQNYDGDQVYRESKLANILMAYEFARRLAATGFTVNAFHPGIVDTGLLTTLTAVRAQQPQAAPPLLEQVQALLYRLRARLRGASVAIGPITPSAGAETALLLACDPGLTAVTGKYFAAQTIRETKPATYDEALAQRLWDYSDAVIERVLGEPTELGALP